MSGLITLKRAAELHFTETEAVAELVRGVGKLLHFRSTLGIEQIQLFAAMREAAQAHSEKPHLSFHIAMDAKQFLKNSEDVSVKARGLGKRFRSSVRFETRVTNGQRKRSRCQPSFAQALAAATGAGSSADAPE